MAAQTAAKKAAAAAARKKAAAKKAREAERKKNPAIHTGAVKYGWSEAVIKSNGSLLRLFNKAVKQKWTAEKFTASLKDTPWYKNHSASWREAENLRLSDPGEWKRRVNQESQGIKYAAAQLGATVDAEDLRNLAEQSLRGGWTDAQKTATLASYVDTLNNGSAFFGQAGEVNQALRKTAAANGVAFTDDWYKSATKAVMSGTPVEQFEQDLRNSAASTYPMFAEKIKAGQNVRDIASPYISSMQQILEIPEDQVDLNDPLVAKALKGADEAGNPAVVPLWKFEQTVRSDPRWMTTKNAGEVMDNVAESMKQKWGL